MGTPSGGAAVLRAPEELEPKKTKPTLPNVTEAAVTPPTSPTKSQKKKQLIAALLGSPKEHLRNGSQK